MMRSMDKEEMNAVPMAPGFKEEGNAITEQSFTQALSHYHPTTQLLLTTKPLVHRPETGINPLVDAAAYLFSLMGKLKFIKSYKKLDKLHSELVQEITNFQETIKSYRHSSEYVLEYLPISCYTLCVTFDDIISNTPWGNQGKWDEYNLVKAFNQEQLSHESFLIILERLVRDPHIYIDMMEFMYICLNLGFKCHYNNSEYNHEQLEQIINSLYKRIRIHRGTISKSLSPHSVKTPQRTIVDEKKIPTWIFAAGACLVLCSLIAIGKYFFGPSSYAQPSMTQNEQ